MCPVAARVSASAFHRRSARVVERLRGEVAAFAGGEAERTARLRKAADDPIYFCATYLPHYFSHPFAPFHRS